MVTWEKILARALEAAATVTDPEIPALTIADLGVLRGAEMVDGTVEILITPTYSGCPAMHVIAVDIETALEAAGIANACVKEILSPAWTSDWLSDAGREKLAASGIAPPPRAASRRALFDVAEIACPRCGSVATEVLAEFGSTACKSLHRCSTCREPFDAFKCHR